MPPTNENVNKREEMARHLVVLPVPGIRVNLNKIGNVQGGSNMTGTICV
jgi:hypothetical protein